MSTRSWAETVHKPSRQTLKAHRILTRTSRSQHFRCSFQGVPSIPLFASAVIIVHPFRLMSCYNCMSLLFLLMYTIVSSRLPLLSLGMMCHSSRIIARPSCRPYSYLLFSPRCPTKSQPLPIITTSCFSDLPLVQRFSDSILYTFTRISLDESTSMTLTDEHIRMARCQFSCPVKCCTSGNTPRI